MNWLAEALTDRAHPDEKSIERAKSLPQPILDALGYEDIAEIIRSIEQGPVSADFIVGEQIVLPYHGWDLNEANLSLEKINLKVVRNVDLMGGPGFAVYEKKDPTLPAYAWAFYWEDSSLIWMEF